MSISKADQQRRRSKRTGVRFPKWVRVPTLLRSGFFIGITLYRIWRLWRYLVEYFES